jgi:hypothetical protein
VIVRLYKNGTLINQPWMGFDPWIILGRCAHPSIIPRGENAYVIANLRTGKKITPVFRIVHGDYQLISEAL